MEIDKNEINDPEKKKENVDEISKNILIYDLFIMDDIQKYRNYGKIPFILIMTIFLVILFSTLVVLKNNQDLFYRSHLLTVNSYFYPNNLNAKSLVYQYSLQSIDDFRGSFDNLIKNIYSFRDYSIEPIEEMNLNNLTLNVIYKPGFKNQKIISYHINKTNSGPLAYNNTDLRNFLFKVDQLDLNYKYQMKYVYDNNLYICTNWEILFKYKIMKSIEIYFEIDYFHSHCSDIDSKLVNKIQFENYFYLFYIIILLLGVHGYFLIRRILFSINSLKLIKKYFKQQSQDNPVENKWKNLKSSDKRIFFSNWLIFLSITDFIQLLTCIICLSSNSNPNSDFLIGLSAFLSWISMCYFLERSETFSNFYTTLKRSSSTFIKIIIFMFNFFIGMVLLAISIFNLSYPMSGFQIAFISLFCMMYGDTVFDNFAEAFYYKPLFTMIFQFFFTIMFYVFITKFLTTVVLDALESTKFKKRLYWLDKKFTIEDYIKFQFHNTVHNIEDHSDLRMMILVDVVEDIILATDQDPELYISMQKELFLKTNEKITKEDERELKKEYKRLVTKKFNRIIENEFFSGFENPDYIPKIMKLNENGLVNWSEFNYIMDNNFESMNWLIKSFRKSMKDQLKDAKILKKVEELKERIRILKEMIVIS